MALASYFGRREVDSVTDKIGDDLSMTKGITDELIWNVGLDVIREVKTVLRSSHNEGLGDAKDNLTKRIRHGFHSHTTSLNCTLYIVRKCPLKNTRANVLFKNIQDSINNEKEESSKDSPFVIGLGHCPV